jgi:hypothetical protein
LLITTLGSPLAFMDGSIVNVALPTLQRAFHASVSSVQWGRAKLCTLLCRTSPVRCGSWRHTNNINPMCYVGW